MSTKSVTVVSNSAPVVGKVNASLLATYGASIESYASLRAETIMQTVALEIDFMRASVASGLSVRDQQATLRAGQEKAKEAGYKVLPDLGVGKVQVWESALYLIDNAIIPSDTDFADLLNLAWNSKRLPEGFDMADKSLEEIESAIPPREVKGNPDKPAVSRKKTTTRAVPTLSELAQLVEQVVEGLPADLGSLSEFDLVAIAKIAKHFASLSRKVSKTSK